MITSLTYFVDATNPRYPLIHTSMHEGEAKRMPPDSFVQTCLDPLYAISGSEVIRLIDTLTSNIQLSRYQPMFGHMMGPLIRSCSYSEMLEHLTDTRREVITGYGIAEVEQLDDRDLVYAITFYTVSK
ncbi:MULTISPECIES: hypothetical protein [unclassified Bradyrhizobium]|uniref:hypothetical protein n=1 Tax=unclassified Bradyrhizobium TaxID=2631580 RepID=UPI003394C676